ncbi:hypothetical protein B7494_g3368, partial [Chlorociboria aeruginascens]
MSSPIDLIAILSPSPGKADRIEELLLEVSEYVKKSEPGTLKYQIHREVSKKTGAGQVILFERYESKAALGVHAASTAFKDFNKKIAQEGLLGSPMQLKFIKETHPVIPLLFTSHTGEVFEMQCNEPLTGWSTLLSKLRSSTPKEASMSASSNSLALAAESMPRTQTSSARANVSPLIMVSSAEDLQDDPAGAPSPNASRIHGGTLSTEGEQDGDQALDPRMVYNEYGELVGAQSLLYTPKSSDLSVLQLLRLLKKAHHHDLKNKMAEVIGAQMDGWSSTVVGNRERLLSWEFTLPSPTSNPSTGTPNDRQAVAVYQGPPRVLEIGCGDGCWCFQLSKEQPDWIIEGIDDANHWSCVQRDLDLKDFMDSDMDTPKEHDGYFSRVHMTQAYPEFTLRNINCLLNHPKPILHNLYGLVRGRDIFDRVENYKAFLEDVRLILRPDGVVEFLEVDPRPRSWRTHSDTLKDEHESVPGKNWTDQISDRFKNPSDEQLATMVPGWMERVEERLKANLRPRDGLSATQLKSWLQGAGFWDVKQIIIRLPIGGSSIVGQRLKDFMKYQLELENSIPTLLEFLPKVEESDLESGKFFLNLHIVTGRKPPFPRAGDLLLNGTRQEMTDSKYDVMTRFKDKPSNNWQRFLSLPSETNFIDVEIDLIWAASRTRLGVSAFLLYNRLPEMTFEGRILKGDIISFIRFMLEYPGTNRHVGNRESQMKSPLPVVQYMTPILNADPPRLVVEAKVTDDNFLEPPP